MNVLTGPSSTVATGAAATATQPPKASVLPLLPLSHLCRTCKSVFSAESAKNEFGEVPHHDLENLAARAARGCHLCLTVYMALDPDAFRNFQSKASSIGFAWISLIAKDQARLRFRYIGTKSNEQEERARPLTSGSRGSDDARKNVKELEVELLLVNPRHAVPPGVSTLSPNATSTT